MYSYYAELVCNMYVMAMGIHCYTIVMSCHAMSYSQQKVLLYNWNEEAVVGKYKGPEKDITQVRSLCNVNHYAALLLITLCVTCEGLNVTVMLNVQIDYYYTCSSKYGS